MGNIVSLDDRRPTTVLRRLARELRDERHAGVGVAECLGDVENYRGPGDLAHVREVGPGRLIPIIQDLEACGLVDVADDVSLVCSIIEGPETELEAQADRLARKLDHAADVIAGAQER